MWGVRLARGFVSSGDITLARQGWGTAVDGLRDGKRKRARERKREREREREVVKEYERAIRKGETEREWLWYAVSYLIGAPAQTSPLSDESKWFSHVTTQRSLWLAASCRWLAVNLGGTPQPRDARWPAYVRHSCRRHQAGRQTVSQWLEADLWDGWSLRSKFEVMSRSVTRWDRLASTTPPHTQNEKGTRIKSIHAALRTQAAWLGNPSQCIQFLALFPFLSFHLLSPSSPTNIYKKHRRISEIVTNRSNNDYWGT